MAHQQPLHGARKGHPIICARARPRVSPRPPDREKGVKRPTKGTRIRFLVDSDHDIQLHDGLMLCVHGRFVAHEEELWQLNCVQTQFDRYRYIRRCLPKETRRTTSGACACAPEPQPRAPPARSPVTAEAGRRCVRGVSAGGRCGSADARSTRAPTPR